MSLARLTRLEIAPSVDLPGAFRDAIGNLGLVVALPVRELGPDEIAKLEKELAAVEREAGTLRVKLGNVAFLAKAKPDVVEKNRKQLQELEERRARLASNLGRD